MIKQSYFLIFISSLMLFNCATLTTGQDQVISIDTPNCPAASCKLTNSEGTYYVNRTPGTVTINKSGSNLNVICGMNGSEEAMSTDSNTESMTWGNILVGGLIGYAVDAGTGSAYEYPSLINHPLDCRDGIQSSNQYNPGGAKVSMEEKLIKLKKLFDNGLISEDLYIKQQASILEE